MKVLGPLFGPVGGGPPIERLLRPVHIFIHEQASGGIVLLLCAVAALVWANSPWDSSYERLWETHLRVGVGPHVIDEPVHFWINDALMALFFFVVGLEIKRAVLVGELASPRRAALPLIAALGGMVVPAGLYVAFNGQSEGARGWGIPMSTDIAFSLGVMALLGSRAPLSLKVFLSAVAIADDIGAVVVIALYYTGDISWANLALGGGLLALLGVLNRMGVRHSLVYAAVGSVVWFAFLKSGVHATVAGVLMAAMIPGRVKISSDQFLLKGRALLEQFEGAGNPDDRTHMNMDQRAALHQMDIALIDVESPLQRMEHQLHPWVAFGVMPLFALSNAGVHLDSSLAEVLADRVTLGIVVGLVVGKQIGITLFTWLAVRTGLAALPVGVTWRQVYGMAWVGGIGFTMSMFIAGLALPDAALVSEAKIGILAASIIAGAGGWLALSSGPRPPADSERALDAQGPLGPALRWLRSRVRG